MHVRLPLTKTKIKDPTCAIFLKCIWCNGIKYDHSTCRPLRSLKLEIGIKVKVIVWEQNHRKTTLSEGTLQTPLSCSFQELFSDSSLQVCNLLLNIHLSPMPPFVAKNKVRTSKKQTMQKRLQQKNMPIFIARLSASQIKS